MEIQFPRKVEEADEAFWRKQENRKKGSLGQPCCTQSKMSWALMDVPGDFAVVIHGENDCLNCFHHHLGINAHNFYSSRLTDHQITTGTTQEPLEHLLRLIIEHRKPRAVIVLGTCPVEVIGDRFEEVARRVTADTGTPILAMHTSGLKMSSLTHCQDWLFHELAGLPQTEPVDQAWVGRAVDAAMEVVLTDRELTVERTRDLAGRLGELSNPVVPEPERRLNFLGLPSPAREPVEILDALGLAVNGFFPHGASLDHWGSVSQAKTTFAVDAGMYPKLTRRLKGYGQKIVDVELPIGLTATERFYRRIAGHYGAEARLEAVMAEHVGPLRDQVVSFKGSHGGARLAMTIRMLNTYQVDRLAQDGMGEVEHLRELGFEVTLLVQGPLEEGPRFEARLREGGVDLPVLTFPGPFRLGQYLEEGGFDVCIVPDSSRNTARRAGLPMMSSRSLKPWLSGIEHNLAVLSDLVQQGRAMKAVR